MPSSYLPKSSSHHKSSGHRSKRSHRPDYKSSSSSVYRSSARDSTFSHVCSLILYLAAALFLCLIIFYSVPITLNMDPNPSSSGMGTRWWFVKVTKGFKKETPYKLDSSATTFGFGVWGWCEWMSGSDTASCRYAPFWTIPSAVSQEDPVESLNLPR